MDTQVKVETVEEFLARGGKIQRIPASKVENKQQMRVKGTPGSYKSEIYAVKTKRKEKCDVSIDYTQIPSDLLEKILNHDDR